MIPGLEQQAIMKALLPRVLGVSLARFKWGAREESVLCLDIQIKSGFTVEMLTQ